GLHAHLARQPRHRLEVVREHVGRGVHHDVDRAGVALEVAGQHLQHHVGRRSRDGADGRRPVRGAAVGEVVAVDAGDHGVPEAQLGQHRRDVLGLVRVGGQRPSGGDVPELARPRADTAQDHDGQRLAVPAFPDVGAGGALADSVQAQLGHTLLEVEEDLAGGHLHPDPGRLRLELGARVGRLASFSFQDAQAARAGFDNAGRHAWDGESTTPIDVTLGALMQRGSSWSGVVIVFSAAVVLAPLAHAEPVSNPVGDKDASRLYQEATSAFGLGHYAEAAEKYEGAFSLRPDPALLYNAAQSYRLAGIKTR